MNLATTEPNRKKQPDTPPLPKLEWGQVYDDQLQGGLRVSMIKNGDYAIFTLRVVMDAGSWQSKVPGVASLMAELLPKTVVNGRKVTEIVEEQGGHLDCIASLDRLEIVLSAMRRDFDALVPAVVKMLCHATFTDEDFDKLKKIVHERLKQDAVDPERFAAKTILNRVFGGGHPYGYMLTHQDLDALCLSQLKEHLEYNAWRNVHIYLSGDVTDEMMASLNDVLGHVQAKGVEPLMFAPQPAAERDITFHQTCVQAVLHMAHKTITLRHADYSALYCTIKLLGGFFGSRLMANLREDKGYTYGVHGYLTPFRHDGLWQLATSVKKEHVAETQQEIVKEIKCLHTTLVKEEELEMLKSYLTGELLSCFDNPFRVLNQLKKAHLHEQGLDHYQDYYQTIQCLSPRMIQATAQQYLGLDAVYQVVVTE